MKIIFKRAYIFIIYVVYIFFLFILSNLLYLFILIIILFFKLYLYSFPISKSNLKSSKLFNINSFKAYLVNFSLTFITIKLTIISDKSN